MSSLGVILFFPALHWHSKLLYHAAIPLAVLAAPGLFVGQYGTPALGLIRHGPQPGVGLATAITLCFNLAFYSLLAWGILSAADRLRQKGPQ